MDLDWPANAPSNYVPIRAGGGATTHGPGTAVSEIDLGDRKVTAVALPPHTPGSTGYLDAENQILVSGDALGSAFVWVQWGPLTRYQQTTHELAALTAPYPKLTMLGAHFYQYGLGPRKQAPINGRPGDRQYILDQAALADGILDGTIIGEPYQVGRETVWASLGSAQVVYSLATLAPPGAAPTSPYHAIAIPSTYPPKWQMADTLKKTLNIKADFHQITGPKGEVFYVLKGTRKTLLVGAGSGAPGLAAIVRRIGGAGPLEVVLTDSDPLESGGLPQLSRARVYAAEPVRRHPTVIIKDGDVIELGLDTAGRPLRLTVQRLGDAFTLLDAGDHILFAGGALGVQGADSGWAPPGGPATYKAALTAWRSKTDGRYDILYTARNYQWFTSPAYVDQLGQALDKAATGAAASADSKVRPGLKLVKSDGAADIVASVGLP
jgi:glyoxylase-like metal-dependent hydrolase (beta-lactamase superfamily II)